MINPQNLSIKDFTYLLPHERIAMHPPDKRDASRLLIYDYGDISEDIFRNIDRLLPENSLLIFNDTRVVEARLMFQKPTGGVIEIFCLEPDEQYPDISTAMNQHENVLWNCLIGGASKWKNGQVLQKHADNKGHVCLLSARYVEKAHDGFVIQFSWNDPGLSFSEILHLFGAMPLPPYIKREAIAADSERYQTVFAHYDGSVAAPTAGLHFSKLVFEKLKNKGIKTDFITLHVGAGTFKPVKTELISGHEMHAEYFSVSKKLVDRLLDHSGKPVIAVGTTSLRTLESIYWMGKMILDKKNPENGISQWYPYSGSGPEITYKQALLAVREWMEKKNTDAVQSKTHIIITPGYRFRTTNGLVTNFHQPQSTLLLLVAACIGSDWKKVYDYALDNEFRFLSYGDSSLLWINQD